MLGDFLNSPLVMDVLRVLILLSALGWLLSGGFGLYRGRRRDDKDDDDNKPDHH